MNKFILLIGFLFLQVSLYAQEPKNVLEIGHRSFYFPDEGLIYKRTNGAYFLLPPTVHFTRYLKNNRWGLQGVYNHYYQEHSYPPFYGGLHIRLTDSFEFSLVYRKKYSSKIFFLFSSGFIYRDSGENRFIARFSIEDLFSSDHIKDFGYRGGAAIHWYPIPHWFLKANVEFQGHLFRVNEVDYSSVDFTPVYNYLIFDIGFGFAFGKGKKKD